MSKKKVAVIFGGQSSEHEVSCMSVCNVASVIDRELYEVLLIGITKSGKWLLVDSTDQIRDGSWVQSSVRAVISPDQEDHGVLLEQDGEWKKVYVDAAFPVMHGHTGEDGCIQGLLEMSGIPYVGCGVLSSAVTMDKCFTKLIVERIGGIRQADYEIVRSQHLEYNLPSYIEIIEGRFDYPVFVKPACGGSSCGVTCAHDRMELQEGLLAASVFDEKILVEESIVGREIETAVYGGAHNGASVSGVGEILAAADFYDYDAKYNNPQSRTVVDPEMDPEIVETIREQALRIFQAVDGYGLARVDFFVKEDGTVVFNEINAIPGFTAISMYPMLWEARGVSKEELVNGLIKLGLERYKDVL